jgi:hypothetical protein
MSNTCKSCGSSIANPFDLSQSSSDTCQCNLGGTVAQSTQLPSSACCVVSVNGKTGVVVLNISDIDLQGNTFYSNAQVYAALSGTAPINFNSANGIISHNASGVTAGTYGSASVIPVITVDAKGHVTAVSTQSIGSLSIGPDLTAIEALTGTGYAVRSATNTWVLRTISGTAGRIAVANGDGVAGATSIDLATTAVSPGTYGGASSFPVITVDAYGRITGASTNSIPTPILPAHTHSLGNLSNVANAVDTTAAGGDYLIWDGTQWTYSNGSKYLTDTMTLDAGWAFCTGNADIDAAEMDAPINLCQRHVDYNEKQLVSINCAMYTLWDPIFTAASVSGTSFKYYTLRVGTLPPEFRPIHTLNVPASAYLRSSDYWNSTHAAQFAGDQILNRMDVLIDTNGDVRLFVNFLSDYLVPIVDGDSQLILHLSCTYPTKIITP